MYRAVHTQVTCTKMVGLYRLSLILDKMQKCVYTLPSSQSDAFALDKPNSYDNQITFAKYQAYYDLLMSELEKTQSQSKKLLRSTKKRRTNS